MMPADPGLFNKVSVRLGCKEGGSIPNLLGAILLRSGCHRNGVPPKDLALVQHPFQEKWEMEEQQFRMVRYG